MSNNNKEKNWKNLPNKEECGLTECGLTESKENKNESNLTKKSNEEKE